VKATRITACMYIRNRTNLTTHTMEETLQICNALRLTENFDITCSLTRDFYWVGNIGYYSGHWKLDDEGTKMLYVCFWKKHNNERSDIPECIWLPETMLERALDEKDRDVYAPGVQ